MNCAAGHNHDGNIHLPSIKSVYVKGTQKTPSKISEIAKLMRNFLKLSADLFPKISTIITVKLPTKAKIEVNEYKKNINNCIDDPKASNLLI